MVRWLGLEADRVTTRVRVSKVGVRAYRTRAESVLGAADPTANPILPETKLSAVNIPIKRTKRPHFACRPQAGYTRAPNAAGKSAPIGNSANICTNTHIPEI